MQIEIHISNNRTTTFIVAGNDREAETLKEIAPINKEVTAVLIEDKQYKYPYLEIVYKGVMP